MPDPNLSSFIWSIADLLRGDYKQSEYGKVILLFTVLRRLDCVLESPNLPSSTNSPNASNPASIPSDSFSAKPTAMVEKGTDKG